VRIQPRFVLLSAAVAVLAVVTLAVVLWPAPPVPRSSVEAPPPSAVAAVAPPTPTAPTPREPVSVPTAAKPAEAPQEVPAATVVPIQPEDVVPSLPVENAPPVENDPILPEKPQTARWRLAKTERITTLLDRDVERLEREREAAEARGDTAQRKHLEIVIQRHRARLGELREEMVRLAEAARDEPPEE